MHHWDNGAADKPPEEATDVHPSHTETTVGHAATPTRDIDLSAAAFLAARTTATEPDRSGGLGLSPAIGRIGRSLAGGLLVAFGVVLIPLPGPGLLVVAGGLLILARDYAWADRLLSRTRERARRVSRTLRHGRADEPAHSPHRSPEPQKEDHP
jgi:hypothetical protein